MPDIAKEFDGVQFRHLDEDEQATVRELIAAGWLALKGGVLALARR